MGVFKAIGKGIGKGVGALARGVRNRKITKSGGSITGNKAADKLAAKAFRKENRQARRAARAERGGGFLKRAVTRHREKKAAGTTRRQLRKARKAGLTPDQLPTDLTTGLPDYGSLATLTGGGTGGGFSMPEMNGEGEGESPAPTQENKGLTWIKDNWIVLALSAVGLYIIKKLFFTNKKR